MKANELKINQRVWSNQYWRYLIYKGKQKNVYLFEDFGDAHFALTEKQVSELKEKSWREQ